MSEYLQILTNHRQLTWDLKRVRQWFCNHKQSESKKSFTVSSEALARTVEAAKVVQQPSSHSTKLTSLGASSESIAFKRPVIGDGGGQRLLKRAASASTVLQYARPESPSAPYSSSSSPTVSASAEHPKHKDMIHGRAASFSASAMAANAMGEKGAASSGLPSELRKLETYFRLEHTRIPSNPYAIFQVTSGDELAAQLSFNWLLEERVVAACDEIARKDGLPASCTTDGSQLVDSRIDPFVSDMMEVQHDDGFDDDEFSSDKLPFFRDPFGGNSVVGGADFLDTQPRPMSPSELLFGGGRNSSLAACGVSGKELARMEPPGVREVAFDADDDSVAQPMELGDLAAAVREANSTVQSVRVPAPPSAVAMDASWNTLVVACSAPESNFVGIATLASDGLLQMQEHYVNASDDFGCIHSVALDAERGVIWSASNSKFISGFDLKDLSRGAVHLCVTPQGSGNSNGGSSSSCTPPLHLRGSLLYHAVGSVVCVWDVEDLDATSSDYSSHGADHESLSSISEGDNSPPIMDNDLYGSQGFTASLHSALSRQFCKLCGASVVREFRACSECRADVCVACSHVYKLTSLGEIKPRSICNGCIPFIRKRILGQQQNARMPNLLDRSSRSSISLSHRKPTAPTLRQDLTKGSNVARSVRLLGTDWYSEDGLIVAFDGRPCALVWSTESQCSKRWFVGHTAAVTAIASCSAEPELIATGSVDRSAKLWDSRARRSVLTLEGHLNYVGAIALASLGVANQTFCFTGGPDECVKAWDLRKAEPLYELSTGNNQVRALSWSANASTLLASTYCPHPVSSEWPLEAVRGPKHFARHWDLGYNSLISYSFKA